MVAHYLRHWGRSLRRTQRRLAASLKIYHDCGRAIQLVWATDWRLTLGLASLTLVAGLLPGAIAYVGKLIVDAVVQAAQSGAPDDRTLALRYLLLEALLVILLVLGGRNDPSFMRPRAYPYRST